MFYSYEKSWQITNISLFLILLMTIISLDRIVDFAKKHADARKSLITWKSTVEKAVWKKKQDVLIDFPKVKMIADNRARFEIVYNNYRMIIKINYDAQTTQVRFIGTHNEYDRINAETI